MGVFFPNEKVVLVLEDGTPVDPAIDGVLLARDQNFALRVINLDAVAQEPKGEEADDV